MIINPYRFAAAGGIPTDYRAAYLCNDTGTTLVDETGNYNGTIGGGGTQASGILTLDGTNDYVSLSRAIDDTFGSGFTLSAWIKTTDSVGQLVSTFLASESATRINFQITGSKLRLIMFDNPGTSYIGQVSTASVDDGAWHFVCASWDGTTADSTGINLYIDSATAAASSAVETGTFSSFTASSVVMDIGRRPNADQYLGGDFDNIRIYDRELSASEVGELNSEGHD